MPRLSKPLLFASPEECERAFYEALENADIDAMADLWLQDDDVSCVHPGATRAVGHSAVRASWASLLAAGPIAVRTMARHAFDSPTLAVAAASGTPSSTGWKGESIRSGTASTTTGSGPGTSFRSSFP